MKQRYFWNQNLSIINEAQIAIVKFNMGKIEVPKIGDEDILGAGIINAKYKQGITTLTRRRSRRKL